MDGNVIVDLYPVTAEVWNLKMEIIGLFGKQAEQIQVLTEKLDTIVNYLDTMLGAVSLVVILGISAFVVYLMLKPILIIMRNGWV